MRKGIVVEMSKKEVILLTREGQFLKRKIEKRSYRLGEEVDILNEKWKPFYFLIISIFLFIFVFLGEMVLF
ncbi:anti-sigma factor domain-containing protein [Bacillus carboniphilus]|uniref:Anti-sigma factor domain-containing protein n=1 Tax=Bacillus carboniphilus TaxID=86663 RepID=A0ABY9JUM0_9BACI|nr:anti-sigma factor domain-containing protein [Bacillus carboniphilus]WLR43104.1 anti-sigma factor domain-containing protein [Bacillus carboniphilus]